VYGSGCTPDWPNTDWDTLVACDGAEVCVVELAGAAVLVCGVVAVCVSVVVCVAVVL
jgi:hypothetical protein